MAKKNPSVEEILAACRKMDGDGAPSESPADSSVADAVNEPVVEAAAASAPAAPAKKPSQGMSVEEMLAAARGEKPGAPAAPATPAEPAAATSKAPADSGKKPSKSMSVEEMMAAARSEKGTGAAASKAAAAAPKAAAATSKPAKSAPKTAKPAGSKGSGSKTAAVQAGPRDTSSVLAAARKSDQRGPMSKAEAAGKGVATTKPKRVAPPLPEKPAYAKSKPPAAMEDRRGFIQVLFGSFVAIGFVCLAGVTTLWGLGLARFLFPNILTEPPSQFKVGFPADFPPDAVVTKYKAQYGVWVVNSEYEGQRVITALKSVCTHLGCTPNWLEGEQKFKCPCHGSGFYKDGINFEGPAPRPLERYAIQISSDGQLEIDKSKKFQQEMGQWNDSSSFVPV